jgi:iron complex outermembrane receptor protein
MTMSKSNLLIAAAVAMACGSFSVTAVSAEDAANTGVLEEVTVTARKRAENLQDLGTSISALGSADLERRADIDLQSFANAAPNVIINDLQQGPGSPAAISIRGIGTTDVEKNFDPTAGVVVDGVFIGVNSGAMIKALDLQSIEILRGPQGTLFGRNSIAGVINVTRGKPSTDGFSGAVRANGGNFGELSLDGYINVPLSDKFAFKIGASKRDNDGWFYNQTRRTDSGKVEYMSLSPSLTFKPTDNFEFTYRYDKTEQEQDANTVLNMAQGNQIFCLAYGECAKGVQTPSSGDRYTVLQNGVGSYQTYFDSELHSATARFEVNEGNAVEYVFGKFSTDEKVFQDWDGTARTLYHTDRPAVWNQDSHELRWVHSGDRLDFTAGLYLWESDYRIDLRSYIGFGDVLFGLPAGTVLTIDQTVVQNTESQAAFFEADYRLTDALTLTVGGRYTEDDKDSGLIDASMPDLSKLGSLSNPFKKSWSEFTPKVNLRWRFNEDAMVYGLYSKGFRAGGFSGRPGTYEAASIAYDPETVDNYEIGWKTEWLDGRVRFNGSVFMMKYDDKQEELHLPDNLSGTGQKTVVANASTAEMKGIEFEIQAEPTDSLYLRANLAYLDAAYDEFTFYDALLMETVDFSNLDFRRAPEWTANVDATYEWDVAGNTMWARVAWHYLGEHETNFDNSPELHNDAQNLVDASINYDYGKTRFSLFGRNLTDEDGYMIGYDVASIWSYSAARPPRTWGIEVTHEFGE